MALESGLDELQTNTRVDWCLNLHDLELAREFFSLSQQKGTFVAWRGSLGLAHEASVHLFLIPALVLLIDNVVTETG